MAEWLFEIFSEEIPSRMQRGAVELIKTLATSALHDARLKYDRMDAYVTPRRLTLCVTGLPLTQDDFIEERKGPRVDGPEKAIEGFLQTAGLCRDECEERETPKGTFLFVVKTILGQETKSVLADVSQGILQNFRWPKSMRWGNYSETWVRPVRGLLNIFEGEVVEMAYGPVASSNTTQGHRFLSPKPFDVSDFAEYTSLLRTHHVILDQAERRQKIKDMLHDFCDPKHLTVVDEDALLDEVSGLVEWPSVVEAQVDDAFMGLPLEVITTPMRVHQRYFPLKDASGKLVSTFLIATNIPGTDGGDAIRIGNERVLRARLADAQFFWEQDQKNPLESYNEKLKNQLFYQGLGTLYGKVERLQKLVEFLAPSLGVDSVQARRGAQLAKADLATQMVYEFPEVEGIMGSYYAALQGEDKDVVQAIREHYLPKGADDGLPESLLSRLIGVADRMDTLVGFFAIGLRPTGSKDPYALRRTALGLLRLILDPRMTIDLKKALPYAYGLYVFEGKSESEKDTLTHLWSFLMDRLKNYLRDVQGSAYDHVEAVISVMVSSELYGVGERTRALDAFLDSDDGRDLVAAYKRAVNIMVAEEKKGPKIVYGSVDPTLFEDEVEKALHGALNTLSPKIDRAREARDFVSMMAHLSTLRGPVDAFFEAVMVNADDAHVRQNRFNLLHVIRSTMDHVADFSRIEQK